MTLTALLWDVDGTLAETERDGHRVAFNQAFEACGSPWRWNVERYGESLAVTGGRERLLHDMSTCNDAPVLPAERDELARRIHRMKNALYAEIVAAGGIALRPGVRELMDECRQRGVRMVIATTTSRVNVEALLRSQLGASWAHWTGGWLFNFSGVTMDLDPYAARGQRASNVRVGGQPLDLAKDYSYASYWYSADPGLINVLPAVNIVVLKDSDGSALDGAEVVVRYLESLPNNTADVQLHRISLKR